jgi:hypothetical protein
MANVARSRVLARCNGFRVTAGGEVVGAVATPVFSGTGLLPDYLLVQVTELIPGAYRAITPNLIADVDAASESIALDLTAAEMAALPEPEHVPLNRGCRSAS